MNLYSDYDLLEITFKSLVSKDENERKRAVVELKWHVEAAIRELSTERFNNFEIQLFQVIFACVVIVLALLKFYLLKVT